MSPIQRTSQIEKEIVLMVNSGDPEATVQKVLELQSLKRYFLGVQESFRLRDIYFETSTGSLGRKRINLRIRRKNEAWLITMKRSPGILQWKRNERAELELPWSGESLDRILSELSASGIVLSTPQHLNIADPVETLESIGLLILQDRETERRIKNISSNLKAGENLAEMAADCVTYHFQPRNVRLYELEVEAKDRDNQRVLTDMKAGLLDAFGSELIPWKWGKLVTGKMIGKLLRAGSLSEFSENDLLSPMGIGKVESALRGR